MMRAVLADLALDDGRRGRAGRCGFAARSIVPPTDPSEAAYARLLTPAVKYWVCKTRAGASSTRRWSASAAMAMSRTAHAGAALSRGAGQCDLGRLRQRHGLDMLRALSREAEAAQTVIVAPWRRKRAIFRAAPKRSRHRRDAARAGGGSAMRVCGRAARAAGRGGGAAGSRRRRDGAGVRAGQAAGAAAGPDLRRRRDSATGSRSCSTGPCRKPDSAAIVNANRSVPLPGGTARTSRALSVWRERCHTCVGRHETIVGDRRIARRFELGAIGGVRQPDCRLRAAARAAPARLLRGRLRGRRRRRRTRITRL